MKKTEDISLGGYAFTIEEDAFVELNMYLDEIQIAFASDPSVEEITADIETRIAELLKEKYIIGMVVDTEAVMDIKRRIGDPKTLAPDESQAEDAAQQETEKKNTRKINRSKRLYRNIDERVIGGVCSGLGTFFGLDKVIFRIFFMIFFMIGFLGIDDGPYFGFSVLAYICLWIAMPAARTAEQKREMWRQPINLDNYKSKDFNIRTEAKEAAESPAGRTFVRAGGIFLGMLLLLVGLGGLLGCVFLPALPELIENLVIAQIDRNGQLDTDDQLLANILTDTTFWSMLMGTLAIVCIWFIYNAVMLLFNLKYPVWKPGVILFIAGMISLFVIIGWIAKNIAIALPGLI